ncbi:MAG: cytochrome c [Bryobacteraceae bacterium]|nr:cytochrome c [Bryobacteraceae bacterium]
MRVVLLLLTVAAMSVHAQHGSDTAVKSLHDASRRRNRCRRIPRPVRGLPRHRRIRHRLSGPSLKTGIFRYGRGDEDLFLTITRGVPGTSTPGFKLNGRVTWQLVSYLRSLAVSTRAKTGDGEPAAGEKLFTEYCAGWHSVSGSGGLSAPNLTEIAALRSDVEILDSLVHPNAIVGAEYWTFAGQTKAGRPFRGTRLNEDTHSIQIRDTDGRLTSFRKQDLSSVELIRESPMPSFGKKLTEAQMDHIIAWLASVAGSKGK